MESKAKAASISMEAHGREQGVYLSKPNYKPCHVFRPWGGMQLAALLDELKLT